MTDLVTRAQLEAEAAAVVDLTTKAAARIATASSAFCNVGTTGFWFTVAPEISTLPPPPEATINVAPAPANAVTLPEDFDDTDLCYLFQDLLPVNVPPVYPAELDPEVNYQPYSEVVPLLGVTVVGLTITERPYELTVAPSSIQAVIRSKLAISELITYATKAKLSITESTDEDVVSIFKIATYTGTNGAQSITGAGFKPGLVWLIPADSFFENKNVFDKVRGATKAFTFDSNSSEYTDADSLISFDEDGFSLGDSGNANSDGTTYIAAMWKEGGAAASNTEGTISTSVSYNDQIELSTITYTGNGVSGATIGHGLSAAPGLTIFRNRSINRHSIAGGTITGDDTFIRLDGFGKFESSSAHYKSATSTLITIGDDDEINADTNQYVAYAFAQKENASVIGVYIGNGTTKAVTVGFLPKFLIVLPITANADFFGAYPTNGTTGASQLFYLNFQDFIYLDSDLSFTADGFEVLGSGLSEGITGGLINSDEQEYMYIAFA